MKKIIVSDYDQTFYLNDDDLYKNKEAVNECRKEGNIFIFATGRSYADFKRVSDLYNLEYDYLIINHGATILDKEDNNIINYTIDNAVVKKIISDLDIENAEMSFFCNFKNSRANVKEKDLTKIHVSYSNINKAKEINKLINEKYFEFVNCYHVTEKGIEVISNKTNKSHAITKIAEREKISFENIYTIGDGYSDIEMIKKYNGYCMEKSVKELLEMCKDKKVKSVSEFLYRIKKGE